MCFRPPSAQKKSEPCPECGAMKDPLVVCPECGFVPEIECPQCGTKNPVTGDACVSCGFKAAKVPPPPPGMPPKAPPKAPPAPPKAPPSPPKAPPKAPPAPPKKPGE